MIFIIARKAIHRPTTKDATDIVPLGLIRAPFHSEAASDIEPPS
jgi:hypothetical protein